jgi:hypothetical protein
MLRLYKQCSVCRKVYSDSSGKYTDPSIPSPCCGAIEEVRIIWPPTDASYFLELVFGEVRGGLTSLDSQRIAVVFMCTVLEALLHYELWELLSIYTDSRKLIKVILKHSWSRKQRLNLYKQLRNKTLGDVLRDLGYDTFMQDWNILVEQRNNLIHGEYFVFSKEPEPTITLNLDSELIERISSKCLAAFMEVHNDIKEFRQSNQSA